MCLLLADHTPRSKRGWASFGGAHEPGGSPTDTAARETGEETRGQFRRADILKAIGTQEPVFDGSYALFFAVEESPEREDQTRRRAESYG